MAIWSEISASQVEYSRIDADYYHPSYLAELRHWRRLEERLGVSKLAHLISVPVRTGRTPRSRQPKAGEVCVHFIKTDTIREGSVDFLKSDALPARVLGFKDYIPSDAVVITIIGATPEIVGRTAIVRATDPKCITNQNIAVVCTNGRCDPYYLTAYFQTKLGRDQLWRHSRRTEQVNLNCREVERVLVPLPADFQQREIGDYARDSFKASDQSITLYQQAQQILESELGLDKLSFQKPVGYTARFSELEQSRRLDSEHYYPAFKNLLDHLPVAVKLTPLSSHLSFCQRGKQPSYTKHGLPVINSKHVQPNKVIFEGNRRAAANPISDLQIRYGDVVVNGTGRGTIGRASPYLEQSEAVPDNHVTILRSPDLDPVFVSLYMNSAAGQLQVEMHQRGSSGKLELYPFDIRKFLIWSASETLQKELRSLVDRASATERKSKELLEQAKTRVEQLIDEVVRS